MRTTAIARRLLVLLFTVGLPSLFCQIALVPAAAAQDPILINHTSVARFDEISATHFDSIRQNLDIYYGHTSHGSQLVTGMQMLRDQDPTVHALPGLVEVSDDLGHTGDVSWAVTTRAWLDQHPGTDVVMWSWCGGCSDNTDAGIDAYLAAMNQLEMDYPGTLFVYMTGHLDGTGPDGLLYHNNNRIRDYCAANGKVLYDFADIESWDPAGTYYPDESDACQWCYTWCAVNDCHACGGCAHSHCFNCYQKGKATWWLLYRLAGLPMARAQDPLPRLSMTLQQNYPNPFNPGTQVVVDVQQAGEGTLSVFDLQGHRLAVLHRGLFAEGRQTFPWTPGTSRGPGAASAVYLCRLQVGEQVQEIKMTLLK